jgi:endophilin-A
LSKIRGQVKNTPYPQPEGTLGDSMSKYGSELGDESHFGKALFDMGECLRQLAGIKYALEDNIKQNFLDPLSQLKDNELKDVMVSECLLILRRFLFIYSASFISI